MNQLKSKAKLIKDIPWTTKITVDKIMFDPNLFEIHKERINKIFEKSTDEIKEQQLQNIMLRDTLFNLSMGIVASCFEFDLVEEEIESLIEPLTNSVKNTSNMPEADYNFKIKDIATKLIQKQLMFEKIAELEKIIVSEEETKKVLEDYYSATNMPIGDILRDEKKFESATRALLEEKITVHIIEKFPRDLEPLHENMRKDVENSKKQQNEQNKQK